MSRPSRARRRGASASSTRGQPRASVRADRDQVAQVPGGATHASRRRWWTSTPRPSGALRPRLRRLRTLYARPAPSDCGTVGSRGRSRARSPGEGFGSRRIINGQPRMPHSGVDFAAERGTPVVASNRGRVALIGEFFFAGRFVVLDHGLGLYTLYFHLDRVDVAEGAVVERGETDRAASAPPGAPPDRTCTGRAQLGSARVDPIGTPVGSPSGTEVRRARGRGCSRRAMRGCRGTDCHGERLQARVPLLLDDLEPSFPARSTRTKSHPPVAAPLRAGFARGAPAPAGRGRAWTRRCPASAP